MNNLLSEIDKEFDEEFGVVYADKEIGGIDWTDGGEDAGKIKLFLHQAVKRAYEEGLEDYSNWLHKHNYMDSDYYTEEPHAVDRYLSHLEEMK